MSTYKKISQLSTAASANSADKLVILSDPNGSPVVQTIPVAALVNSISSSFGVEFVANSLSVNTTFVANSSGVYEANTFSNNLTINTKLVISTSAGIQANGGLGTASQVLTSNGSSVYWADASLNSNGQYTWSNTQIFSNTITFSSSVIVGNSSVNVAINSTAFSGTANNTSYVGSIPAANVVSNAQLVANLAGYQTSSGLSANVATLTANNANNLGGVAAASYQLTGGNLQANIASYLPTYTGTINAAALTISTIVAANSSGLFTTGRVNAASISTTGSANVGVINATGNVYVGGSLLVTGNLSVNGTITAVNSSSTSNQYFTVANGASNTAAANGAGLVAATFANIVFSDDGKSWQSNVNFTPAANNLTVGNTTALWNIYANNITGTLTTSTQPNITANNALFVGSTAAANVVSNAQLVANLAGYQTTNTLASAVSILTSNNTLYLNGVGAPSYVTNYGNTTFTNTIVFSNTITIGTVTANSSNGVSGQALLSNGSSTYWGNLATTLTANNTDANTYYVGLSNSSSGTWTNTVVATTKLYFVPSTGTLSATVFNTLSDATKKTNVVKITNATQTIKQLNGYEFDWADNGKKSAGTLAQELEIILPHLVDENNGVKSVNYSGIIAYLIETIHELDKRINELESKIK